MSSATTKEVKVTIGNQVRKSNVDLSKITINHQTYDIGDILTDEQVETLKDRYEAAVEKRRYAEGSTLYNEKQEALDAMDTVTITRDDLLGTGKFTDDRAEARENEDLTYLPAGLRGENDSKLLTLGYDESFEGGKKLCICDVRPFVSLHSVLNKNSTKPIKDVYVKSGADGKTPFNAARINADVDGHVLDAETAKQILSRGFNRNVTKVQVSMIDRTTGKKITKNVSAAKVKGNEDRLEFRSFVPRKSMQMDRSKLVDITVPGIEGKSHVYQAIGGSPTNTTPGVKRILNGEDKFGRTAKDLELSKEDVAKFDGKKIGEPVDIEVNGNKKTLMLNRVTQKGKDGMTRSFVRIESYLDGVTVDYKGKAIELPTRHPVRGVDSATFSKKELKDLAAGKNVTKMVGNTEKTYAFGPYMKKDDFNNSLNAAFGSDVRPDDKIEVSCSIYDVNAGDNACTMEQFKDNFTEADYEIPVALAEFKKLKADLYPDTEAAEPKKAKNAPKLGASADSVSVNEPDDEAQKDAGLEV